MIRFALVAVLSAGWSVTPAAHASDTFNDENVRQGDLAMSLENDINKGLAAVSAKGNPPFALDARGNATVTVPVPPSIVKLPGDQLLIHVRMSDRGDGFSLLSPLGHFKSLPDAATLEALFHRNYYPQQTSWISYSINPGDNTLVAVFHWPLNNIAEEQFLELFTVFSVGVLGLLEETVSMSEREPALAPLARK